MDGAAAYDRDDAFADSELIAAFQSPSAHAKGGGRKARRRASAIELEQNHVAVWECQVEDVRRVRDVIITSMGL